MIRNPEPPVLRAMHALNRMETWGEIDRYLDAELAAIYEAMTAARDVVTLHQLQGRAMCIKEFKKQMRDASAQLAKQGHTGL